MNKSIVVLIVSNKTGSGKSHMSFNSGDTFVIDTTANGDGQIAAYHVFGDAYEERYKHVTDYDEMIRLIEETTHRVICLETGDTIRTIFAKEYMKRAAKKRGKKVSSVYPVTEWGKVYDIARDLFYKYCDKKSFIITEGTKDRYEYDEERGVDVNTGKKVPDGLKMLPAMCDVMLNVVERAGKRRVTVSKNRFVDMLGKDWIEETDDLNSLFDEMDKNGVFRKEWLVI